MRSTRLTIRIAAPRAEVYRALLDARDVAAWMVPDGMTSVVHELDAREGGAFRISLTYDEPTGAGKTTARTDTHHGRFVELVPDERVVQVVEFETDDPAMRGEMTITYALADAGGGTELRAAHEGLPPGLSAADNEAGWRMSLGKLAALVTARARVTRTPRPPEPAPPADYAALAGMSDDAIAAGTGCTWERWVGTLDHHGAARMSHREIAALVRERFGIGAWWAQSVTVGYERIRGLRARGQRRDGSYEASKSRTYDVPVETLYHAWADARARRRWMDGAAVKVRTATPSKSMRIEVGEGGVVAVGFTAKGDARSTVSVQHTKLPDRESADRLRRWWAERLEALAGHLAAR